MLGILMSLTLASADTGATTCAPARLFAASALTLDPAGASAGLPLEDLELHGVEPEEIDLATQGVEPDEIDFTSDCSPEIVIPGLELHGVEPDEIDDAFAAEILRNTPAAHTKEHVLLAGGGAPAAAGGEDELGWATAALRLVPQSLEIREEVVTLRPYVTRTVADLTFAVEVSLAPDLEPHWMEMPGTTSLVPEQPICGHCGADILSTPKGTK